MKLVTAQQMRALEQRADASGNTYMQMMERAGTLTAQTLMERWDAREQRVLVLVGPGNNGGDGLVCARVLHDAGASVRLYVWKRSPDEDDVNWKLCRERGIPFTRAEEDAEFVELREKLAHAQFVIDALLGTGVTRPIDGMLKDLLDTVRETLHLEAKPAPPVSGGRPSSLSAGHAVIVAVDLPTGLNPDSGALDPAALYADVTVTFALPKVGHYTFPGANAVGELVVADIGIPQEWAEEIPLAVVEQDEIRARLPARTPDANKGTFGKVMIACGSLNFTGAPTLAARAAGRVGAGLVTLALPQTIHAIVASKIDEATFLPLPDRLGEWRPRAANEMLAVLWDNPYDVLLVGCGLGRATSTREFLARLLENLPTLEQPPALVLDADALNHLAEMPEWWTQFSFTTPPILTPHPGEMARLTGLDTAQVQADRIGAARDAAGRWNAIVVLKGAFTVVAAPDGMVQLIPFANSALATAGTGDVLAGTIAGLLAQYQASGARAQADDALTEGETGKGAKATMARALYDAAVTASYVHALAGELVAREVGDAGAVAGDLLPRLPTAIRHLKKGMGTGE